MVRGPWKVGEDLDVSPYLVGVESPGGLGGLLHGAPVRSGITPQRFRLEVGLPQGVPVGNGKRSGVGVSSDSLLNLCLE